MSRRCAHAVAGWLLALAASLAGAQTASLPPQEIVDALAPAASRSAAASPASLSLVLQFEAHSPRVRPASGPLLGNLVAALLAPELQHSRFVIEGPADPGGSAQAHQQLLSLQRAEEVRQYLVALGVPAARLRAVGKVGDDAGSGSETPPTSVRRVRIVAHD